MEGNDEPFINSRQVVVVRWNKDDKTAAVPSEKAIVAFVESVKYKVGEKSKIGWSPCSASESEQFMILPMESHEEAQRICKDSETKGMAINNTKIQFNLLIGPNGICLRDIIDFMRISQECFEDNEELIDILVSMTCLENPDRMEAIKRGSHMIEHGIAELVENGRCQLFGSYASKVRRNAHSDVDVNVQSIDQPGKPGSSLMRPHKMLDENPLLLIGNGLSKAEFEQFPPEDIIKWFYKCFSQSPGFSGEFDMKWIPARTPILVFQAKRTDGLIATFDISVKNEKGREKANVLEEFILKDKSDGQKVREAMMFIVLWARTNKLISGIYPNEKLSTKTNLNSYILNHLVIHFIQIAANRTLYEPNLTSGNRISEYNFTEIFGDYSKFLREFFKYYATFDFSSKAIYGRQALLKKTAAKVHNLKESPLMIIDPMDLGHNISAKVTEDAVKLLNGLIRNALFLLKLKNLRLNYLLQTNETAAKLMRLKESNINISTRQPDVFNSECVLRREEHHYMSIQLPEIIRTSAEFMILLTRVLRFDVSPNHEGPSVSDLYNSMGVIFSVQSKTWIGRRHKKRQLKSSRHDLTALQLDVMCSDLYEFEDDLIAELRMVMSDIPEASSKFVYIELLKGQVSDVHDAMHYLIDQFLLNNLDDLVQNGIMSIENIPRVET